MTAPATGNRAPARAEVEEELEALFTLDGEAAGELLLVRHAEPAPGGAARRETEPAGPMLSCEGLRQAERLADRLGSLWIEAVYSAPERRCFQTARVIADLLQRPLTVVDGLSDIEWHAPETHACKGSYAGRFARDPRWDSLPGFASGKAFRRRAVLAVEAIVAAHPGRRCAVVTHAGVINAYLSMLLCIPRDLFCAPDHASISTVRHRDDLYAVRSLNDTAHLLDGNLGPPPALTPRSLPLTNR